MRKLVSVLCVLILLFLLVKVERVKAQVPIRVWGYVYMPNGSPAVGASVTVSAGGKSKSTTTDSSGKYSVDLTVPSTPVTVKVTAKKDGYKGSASKKGEGVIRIDVYLKKTTTGGTRGGTTIRKQSTKLSITVEKMSYLVGETVHVSGKITPEISATIVIYISIPNGTQVKHLTKSNKEGAFHYEFVADVPGAWKVYAQFQGTKEFAPSKSSEITFYVRVKSNIEVDTSVTEKGTILIRGRTEPPIPNATVQLYVSLDGGKTWMFYCNVTTDENGYFETCFNLTVSGDILFKAVLPEGTSYTSAEEEKPLSYAPKELTEEIQRLSKQVEELEKTEKQLRELISKLESENLGLKSKVEELTQRLRESNETIASLSRLVAEYREKAKNLEQLAYVAAVLSLIVGVAVGYLLSRARIPQAESVEREEVLEEEEHKKSAYYL